MKEVDHKRATLAYKTLLEENIKASFALEGLIIPTDFQRKPGQSIEDFVQDFKARYGRTYLKG